MPRRQPAPFFKKSHKAWYVQIGAKQHRLADDYADALARCAELLKAHKKAARFVTPGEPTRYTLGSLKTEFLRVAFKDRSPRTRDWYEEKLAPLVRHLGEHFPADHLKPLHIEEWVAAHSAWNRGTARTVWQAAQRLMRWGGRSPGGPPTRPSATTRSPGPAAAPSSSRPRTTFGSSRTSATTASATSWPSPGKPGPGPKSS